MRFEDIVLWSKEIIQDFVLKNPDWIVIIRWATATGKSRLSVELSKFFDVEIISSDSRQIFREMNIGTDKVSKEILDRIPHHQIDIVNPDESYTAWQWQKDVQKQIKEIIRLIALPILFQCQCKMELPYSCPLDTRGIRCSDLSQWKKYRLTPLPQKNALTPGQEAKAVWLKSRFEPFWNHILWSLIKHKLPPTVC